MLLQENGRSARRRKQYEERELRERLEKEQKEREKEQRIKDKEQKERDREQREREKERQEKEKENNRLLKEMQKQNKEMQNASMSIMKSFGNNGGNNNNNKNGGSSNTKKLDNKQITQLRKEVTTESRRHRSEALFAVIHYSDMEQEKYEKDIDFNSNQNTNLTSTSVKYENTKQQSIANMPNLLSTLTPRAEELGLSSEDYDNIVDTCNCLFTFRSFLRLQGQKITQDDLLDCLRRMSSEVNEEASSDIHCMNDDVIRAEDANTNQLHKELQVKVEPEEGTMLFIVRCHLIR